MAPLSGTFLFPLFLSFESSGISFLSQSKAAPSETDTALRCQHSRLATLAVTHLGEWWMCLLDESSIDSDGKCGQDNQPHPNIQPITGGGCTALHFQHQEETVYKPNTIFAPLTFPAVRYSIASGTFSNPPSHLVITFGFILPALTSSGSLL